MKGCGLEFRQNGANVEFHAAFARYLAGESGEVDLSAGTDRQIATAADVKDYCVTEFHCTLDARAPSMKVTLDEGFAFATPGIALSVCGTANAPAELELKSATGFPPDGTVDVLAGGVLRLSLTQTLSSGDGALTVHEGGKLLQMGLGSSSALNVFTGVRRPIVADGGEVSFGCAPAGTSGGNDAVDVGGSTYLNAFTMRNGAVYTGKAVRVGNVDPIVPCRWCVDGTVPETFGQSISLLGRSGDKAVELTFDIADVTGDAATDFAFGGDIRIFKNRDYQNVTVVKTGAGTMRIDGLTDYTRNPTQVRGGMWMLGGSDTMNADQSIVLDGGSLGTAEGTANALKDLTVLQDATIVLKRGSSLSFGDCSTMEWESALIDVEGDLSTSQLRFGTSAAALTAAQQRMFRHHGQRMRLRADGVLEAYADGLKILYR